MNLICWIFGHSWRPYMPMKWGGDGTGEAYECRRCGKIEEE